MAVYHQMGHQSENLVDTEELKGYDGVILSPVNYTRSNIETFIKEHRDKFDIVFDPQLYYPRTQKEKLRSWKYFPEDYETLDFSTQAGWSGLITALANTVRELQPHAVCSPAVAPRPHIYSDEYFALTTQVAEMLCDALANTKIDVRQTVLIDLSALADYHQVMSIASIITATRARSFYLVFLASEPSPRRELMDTEELKGAMLLISELKNNSFDVLVGFCCSDILLWKTAGAHSCATGKFWNTRRFNPGRWGEDADAGNGHIAYLMEEALVAFLRDSDVVRTLHVTSEVTKRNPFYEKIRGCIETGQAWVGLGWRHYLYWFYDFERRFTLGEVDVEKLLRIADKNWEQLEDDGIFMEERRNDGRWIRPWLRAIIEYKDPW